MPGSLTKEPPLFHFDNALSAITPGMHYSQLLRLQDTDERVLRGVPGLIRERFLLIDNEEIVFDRFLALIDAEGVDSPRVRKIMYFLWTYRDHRVRDFILDVIADDHGHWSTDALYDKSNSEFFEQTHTEGSSRKARSNIERFLTAETGIAVADTVHLELDDGWLEEAIRVVAQHEPNETIRRRMYSRPIEYVIDQAWSGLANATVNELREYAEGTALTEDGTEEDQDLGPATAAIQLRGLGGMTWNRQQPRLGGNATTTAQINMIARERALVAHHRLEELFVQKCQELGLAPQTNELIDVYTARDGGTIMAEMKSNNARNTHAQLRKGISQLYEYRYIHREKLDQPVDLLLVLETKPPQRKAWLIDYAESLGILVVWTDGNQLVTTKPIPQRLADFVDVVT